MNTEDRNNPGKINYDNTTDFLKRAEENTIKENDQLKNTDDLKKAEENSGWKNNVSSQKIGSKSNTGFKSFIKKKGPLAAILMTLGIGGIGITGLTAPSLLLLQVRESAVDFANTQLTSTSYRSRALYTNKTTTGSCILIKIACKYSSFSNKQLENFKKAGFDIEIDTDASKSLTGRSKVKSFSFEGKTIPASEFNAKLKTDVNFRSAVKIAYNPKLAGLSDNIFSKTLRLFGISKTPKPIIGDTDEARLKSLQDNVNKKNNLIEIKAGDPIIGEDGKPMLGEDGKPLQYTDAEVEANRDFIKQAKELAETGTTAASDVLDTLDDVDNATGSVDIPTGGILGSSVKYGASATGLADMACDVKNSVKALSIAAKTVRSARLAAFAMTFLTAADQIKAGKADPNTISYLGKILTSTKNGKSATDSFGYKYAVYGRSGAGTMPTSASQFIVGGGLAGKLSSVVKLAEEKVDPGVCKILANPVVSVGSMIVGVGMFFVPGANIAWTFKQGAQVAAGVAFGVALWVLPNMLKDIVAGNLVDASTIGDSAGDAFISGSSTIMGTAAKMGGNAPLTPNQAIAYNKETKQILAEYAAEDRLAYGQFDITNSNTFLGKLALSLSPYITNLSSLSGVFSSLTSIPFKSIASISAPISYAESTDDYTMCQDYEYTKLGVATDPFCNIIYGIPVNDLSETPADIAELLFYQYQKAALPELEDIQVPQIDDETGIAVDKYAEFVTQCITRTTPLDSDNDQCLYGQSILLRKEIGHWEYEGLTRKWIVEWKDLNINNKYFYIHYIDQRVESQMDNE